MSLTAADQLLKATAQGAFWQAFESFPSIMDGLVQQVTSNSDQEIYPWLAYSPGVREMTGSRLKRSVPEITWTVRNKKWENTIAINYETRKFSKLNQVEAILSNLGAKARAYPDKLVSGLIDTGASTACYDTANFFSTTHSEPGATYTTNQSNTINFTAATGTVWTDVEIANAIMTGKGQIMGFKDGDGDPFMIDQGSKLIVHCATDIFGRVAAVSVLNSLTGGAGNPALGQFTAVANPWLTAAGGTDVIYVFAAGAAHKPFIVQTADPVSLEDDMGGDNDFNTRDVSFGTFGYYNAAYGDWRCACKVTAV